MLRFKITVAVAVVLELEVLGSTESEGVAEEGVYVGAEVGLSVEVEVEVEVGETSALFLFTLCSLS